MDLHLTHHRPRVRGLAADPWAHRASVSAGDARDPAHVLYDHACDLLAAAQRLRVAAAADGAAPAIAATLGCLESTLDALADCVQRVRAQALDGADPAAEPLSMAAIAEAGRRMDDLAGTLRVSRDLAGGVRHRVGPAVAAAATES